MGPHMPTQCRLPTKPGGQEVGRVLHVATGSPRLMVVTTDTCNGPRAYAAVVSSYFETVTEDYKRLDDEQWKDELMQNGTPDDGAVGAPNRPLDDTAEDEFFSWTDQEDGHGDEIQEVRGALATRRDD